jgi:HK97 family phage prohead protease
MNTNTETVMLYGHDQSGVPLGRVGSGSLRFEDAPGGLMFEIDLPEARADIREALERGDLTGAVSVGFYVDDGGDEWQNKTKPAIRTVRNAELVELSIVPMGAYPQAKGNLK